MEKYKNLSGIAGITAFEILEEGIILEFGSKGLYLYDYSIPGKDHVDRMKVLARKGSGLTTYVNQHVRDKYRSSFL